MRVVQEEGCLCTYSRGSLFVCVYRFIELVGWDPKYGRDGVAF